MKIKKIDVLIFFVLLVIPGLSLADTASTTTETSTSSTPQVLGIQTPAVPTIISQIKDAKSLLQNIQLAHTLAPVYKNLTNKKTKKNTKVFSGYQLTDKDIALAVLNPANNQITITVGRQTNKSMKFSDPAVDISLIRFNGVNSKFQINKPQGGAVLALKYLISGPESGSKKDIENNLSEAVYVPYSNSLSNPDVIKYGEAYLTNMIKRSTADIQNLPSVAVPGKTVPEAIPPTMIKALIYAEHTDTAQSATASDIFGPINQLNILFALNEGDTYKYSVSTANARGIAQFVPSTYQSLVKRHPEANLINDFVPAMSDHENSIKAMYLLLDDYAGAVRVKAQNGFASSRVFDYGAASYNGGTTRVVKAVNQFGDLWNQDRSGQINALSGEVESLKLKVKSLKTKIKTTKDKKTKASLQAELTTAEQKLADHNDSLTAMQAGTLRNETVNYLRKIYTFIQFFNNEQSA